MFKPYSELYNKLLIYYSKIKFCDKTQDTQLYRYDCDPSNNLRIKTKSRQPNMRFSVESLCEVIITTRIIEEKPASKRRIDLKTDEDFILSSRN